MSITLETWRLTNRCRRRRFAVRPSLLVGRQGVARRRQAVPLVLPRNWCLIFLRDPRGKFTSARMRKALRAAGLTVSGKSEPFAVDWGTGPSMLVSIQRGPEIETIVRGLVGQRRQYHDFIPGCDTQIKIELDDVDETLDEINTLITVQSALQDATNGLIYTSWNQNFGAPRQPTPAPVQTPRGRARRVSSRKTPPQAAKPKTKKPGEQEWLTCQDPGYMLGRLLVG